jgi:hypothetical protein
VAEQTDGSSLLKIRLNGETAQEIGCFNLYYTFNLETNSLTLSEPAGVFRIPKYGVMSMISWGLPPLVFEGGQHPESGQASFFAYSTATPCAGLDIGGSGVDSNNSTFTVTATGGGGITLAGESDDGGSFSVHTTWSELD